MSIESKVKYSRQIWRGMVTLTTSEYIPISLIWGGRKKKIQVNEDNPLSRFTVTDKIFIYLLFFVKFNQCGFFAQNWASPNIGSLRDV